jgi:predicted enzyme related to lactoylglutathione lyase
LGAAAALFRKVDCVSFPVKDLAAAIAFYSERLGHTLSWRTPTSAGLKMPETDAELVLHTEATRPPAAELLVSDVPAAIARFQAAGGRLGFGPFEIQIGRCAVVTDPWGNHLVLLDMSKGALHTDEHGNVIERDA